jgi:lysyl-tRNA synthetase class 2
MIIARIIDVSGSTVTYLSGAQQISIDWHGELPLVGEVYRIDGKEFEKLSDAGGISGDVLRWRRPNDSGKTRMEILQRRHIIRRAVRDYLDAEGFIEIDMPLLVRGTTPDAQIDSFAVNDRYLTTSTEYQIKRMEIGGFDKTYTLTQNFRLGDTGTYRNPEFTMLEWARVGGSLHAIEQDAEAFTLAAHRALGGDTLLHYRGATIDLAAPWDRVSVRDAIIQACEVAIDAYDAPNMRKALDACGVEIRADWENDTVFLFTVLLDHLQQGLGFEKPVFLTEWPSFLTSSAREDGALAERSELFIAGIEISDGFPSLTNLTQQIEKFESSQARRIEEGKPPVTLDRFYLDAMAQGFPSGAGMALGFDRLVMALTNQPDIASVLAYSWDEV